MAPSIIWRRLRRSPRCLRILDPMAGSGTAVVASRIMGHEAIGFDTDPLSLLIAHAWSADVNPERLRKAAERALAEATARSRSMAMRDAYPANANEETRAFVRWWFDRSNRRQLAALSASISKVRNTTDRMLMWCAFSRLIITKQAGVSLAMDVSHSRPHKVFSKAPIRALERFLTAIEEVLRGSPFQTGAKLPRATIRRADARDLPVANETFDLVITSPPYLNAIDYLRGHKFSLVWMGMQTAEVRDLRRRSVGAELSATMLSSKVEDIITGMGAERLKGRLKGILVRYIQDMERVLAEIARVLKRDGEAVVVIGDSTLAGVFIRNSRALVLLGRRNGLRLRSTRRRALVENRRYLPPPGRRGSGSLLHSRMREEVVLVFSKDTVG
jgi:SAM-dependent methyltransferase